MTPGGTQITDWELTIKNGGASAASVTVASALTGESIIWSNTLAADAWLRFSSATQRCDVSDDEGATWTRSNANVVGLFPKLRGGVANEITITGPTSGTYTYTYTAKGV